MRRRTLGSDGRAALGPDLKLGGFDSSARTILADSKLTKFARPVISQVVRILPC